jgi:CRISPR-associated protein Csb2
LLKTESIRFLGRPLKLLPADTNAAPWTRTAKAWATVSPTVLGHHPRRGLSAADLIAVDLERRGYPRPVSVEFSRRPYWTKLPDSASFRLRRPGRLYGHAHVTFDRPVTGPVITGAEAHFGMGLMRAID